MKRTAVLTLLLMFHNSLQEAETAEASKPSDPPTELKQLRDVVYQQGTMLVELRTEMKYVKKENAALKTKMAKQIKQTETKVEVLNKEAAALAAEVSAVKGKLAARDKQAKGLKKDNAETRTALEASKSEIKKIQKENAAFSRRLAISESDVDSLKRNILEKSRVAFSAALTESLAPSSDIDVIYTKVFTNVGQAYNPNTGIFTAPVRGVYYFRFTICSKDSNYYSGVRLYKNSEQLLNVYEYNYNGYERYISSGLTLQLEYGDTVRIRLHTNLRLFESDTNRNTFSGFILFTM